MHDSHANLKNNIPIKTNRTPWLTIQQETCKLTPSLQAITKNTSNEQVLLWLPNSLPKHSEQKNILSTFQHSSDNDQNSSTFKHNDQVIQAQNYLHKSPACSKLALMQKPKLDNKARKNPNPAKEGCKWAPIQAKRKAGMRFLTYKVLEWEEAWGYSLYSYIFNVSKQMITTLSIVMICGISRKVHK